MLSKPGKILGRRGKRKRNNQHSKKANIPYFLFLISYSIFNETVYSSYICTNFQALFFTRKRQMSFWAMKND